MRYSDDSNDPKARAERLALADYYATSAHEHALHGDPTIALKRHKISCELRAGCSLEIVEGGNGQADLWKDDQGRAYAEDGTAITEAWLASIDAEDAEFVREVIEAMGLRVRGSEVRP